mgnify:CR=1 FL=1
MFGKTHILLYSHGIRIRPASREARSAMINYCKEMALWEWSSPSPTFKPQRKMTRIYAGATRIRDEFRFHRNQQKDVFKALDAAGVYKSDLKVEELEPDPGVDVEFDWASDKELMDFQKGIVDFFTQSTPIIKVTNLQMGKGKSLISLAAMYRLGKRTVIQLKGGYVSRWLDALEEELDFDKGDVLIVRGRDSLQSVINQAQTGEFEAKVVIITNKTIFNFLKEHERNAKENIYGIEPHELYPLLGVGLRICDEVHEDYHLAFRSDIYCHVASSIHLSATLKTEDSFRRFVYDIALPPESWVDNVPYDRYIGVTALHYVTRHPDKIKIHEKGRDTYSHSAFEKSLLRKPEMLHNYMLIIEECVENYYIVDFEKGQKCAIFCHLVDFCTYVRDYLRQRYPGLKIDEFVSGSPSETLENSDVIVTTLGSAGTAQDIDGLKTVLLTKALRKREMNEQVLGRLRRLKNWPDVVPRFVYFVNTSIPSHLNYHHAKVELFADKCLFHREVYSSHKL